jgi:hypothetical protein
MRVSAEVPAPVAAGVDEELNQLADLAAFVIWQADVSIKEIQAGKLQSYTEQEEVILAGAHYI